MPAVKDKSSRPAATRTRAPAETRQRLIDAALPVFAANGFRAARLEEICAAAGLTRGAFHWHFASKEELLIAVLEQVRAAENEASRARDAAIEDADDVADVALTELAAHDPEFLRQRQLLGFEALLYAARNPEVAPRLAAMKRSGMEVIADRARMFGDDLVLSVEDVTALFQAVNDGLAMQDLYFGENKFAERYQRLFPHLLAAVTGSDGRGGRRRKRRGR